MMNRTVTVVRFKCLQNYVHLTEWVVCTEQFKQGSLMAAKGEKCILMKAGIVFREATIIIWLDFQTLWSQGISKAML